MENFTELLSQHGILGLVTGAVTFLVIGMFHPVVIKCEYYFGVRCWWWFLILGLGGCVLSVMLSDVFLSSVCGVFAFSSFWTIKEIFDQRERVRKGWFPANPRRARRAQPQNEERAENAISSPQKLMNT